MNPSCLIAEKFNLRILQFMNSCSSSAKEFNYQNTTISEPAILNRQGIEIMGCYCGCTSVLRQRIYRTATVQSTLFLVIVFPVNLILNWPFKIPNYTMTTFIPEGNHTPCLYFGTKTLNFYS